MSRETLLDDAIAKAKEAEDWQLVEWLRMARGSESAARWYSDKLRDAHRIERKLMNENAELRELVRDMQRAIVCLVMLGDAYAERHEDELCALDDRMRELGVEV